MKRILCYGDSNTYGYDARDVFGGPLPPEERWTNLLADALGCEVINGGKNGRTVPGFPRSQEIDLHRIERYAPLDLVIVMLGSNDMLLDREPEETMYLMKWFLEKLRKKMPDTKILLLAPPNVSGTATVWMDQLRELSQRYEALSAERGYAFADPQRWEIALAHDGVHFSPEGHRQFAREIQPVVEKLL